MKVDKHILVDGYNVLHAWPETGDLRKKNFDGVRDRLIDALRIIHDAEYIRMTIVFDGKGTTLSIERPTNVLSFSIIYTPAGMSADELIEQLVQKAEKRTEITVFSRDNMVAAAVRASGGYLLPPEALWEWIKRSNCDQNIALDQRRKADRVKWQNTGIWEELNK